MRIRNFLLVLVLFLVSGVADGCWQQYPSPARPLYQQFSSVQTPIGAMYPGTRELMDAPSNDPALNNDRNGVELRP